MIVPFSPMIVIERSLGAAGPEVRRATGPFSNHRHPTEKSGPSARACGPLSEKASAENAETRRTGPNSDTSHDSA